MIQDARGLQGYLACLGSQVSKVPKAKKEVLGFQAFQVTRAVPVKEAFQEDQGKRDSLGLLVVQVHLVGKES